MFLAMSGASPSDIQSLLKRMKRLEEELARTKAELARKNGIIEALQKRIFGSSSLNIGATVQKNSRWIRNASTASSERANRSVAVNAMGICDRRS